MCPLTAHHIVAKLEETFPVAAGCRESFSVDAANLLLPFSTTRVHQVAGKFPRYIKRFICLSFSYSSRYSRLSCDGDSSPSVNAKLLVNPADKAATRSNFEPEVVVVCYFSIPPIPCIWLVFGVAKLDRLPHAGTEEVQWNVQGLRIAAIDHRNK